MLTTEELNALGDLEPSERILVESHKQANARIAELEAELVKRDAMERQD